MLPDKFDGNLWTSVNVIVKIRFTFADTLHEHFSVSSVFPLSLILDGRRRSVRWVYFIASSLPSVSPFDGLITACVLPVSSAVDTAVSTAISKDFRYCPPEGWRRDHPRRIAAQSLMSTITHRPDVLPRVVWSGQCYLSLMLQSFRAVLIQWFLCIIFATVSVVCNVCRNCERGSLRTRETFWGFLLVRALENVLIYLLTCLLAYTLVWGTRYFGRCTTSP